VILTWRGVEPGSLSRLVLTCLGYTVADFLDWTEIWTLNASTRAPMQTRLKKLPRNDADLPCIEGCSHLGREAVVIPDLWHNLMKKKGK
jgi:hypothetical protein